MATMSATEAKQNFAAMLDTAQREPVRIQRHERPVAGVPSAEEYEEVRAMRVERVLRISEENGRYAESRGMTDELLEDVLSHPE